MADVRTFRAATMREALQIVRDEMGADAVILHTRQVETKRRLPWSRPQEEVEITAGRNVNVRPANAYRPRPTPVKSVQRSPESLPKTPQTTNAPIDQPKTKKPESNSSAIGLQTTTIEKSRHTLVSGRLEVSSKLPEVQPDAKRYDAIEEQLKVIQKMLKDLGIGQPSSQTKSNEE